MDTNIKILLEGISNKPTREIIEEHTKELIIDDKNHYITIMIDKKYALNQLSTNDHIGSLIKGVKKSFGEEYETILKSISLTTRGENMEHHDREMNIPHTIHYN